MSKSPKDLIISLPNEHLRERSKRVKVVTDEIRRTIKDMKAATLDWEASRPHEVGVALAAIQIDEAIRVIIVRNNFDNKDDKSFSVFIDPEIVKFEGEVEADFEGCLSVADVYGKVPRHTEIRLRALNEEGREVRVRAKGFLARVIQHEVDHTHGILFIDHIKDNPEAFYKLGEDGKLTPYKDEYKQLAGLFR
jgi:peptide deformylase